MDGGSHDFETRLIRLRLIVARAGENDGLGWWESEALSDAGRFVLKRTRRGADASTKAGP